jgi:hypothetical protein
MRILIFVFLISCFSFSFGQKTIYKKYESGDLRDVRDVQIYLPKSYEKDSLANFPLTIVLDAEKLNDLYLGVHNFYTSRDEAPEQIIVGVNMESTRIKDAGFNITNSKLTQDARRFYTFLRDELIPFVEANYKTSPFLTIVGEGLTANMITHFLQEKNPIFNAYISLNPTLAPDINSLVQNYGLDKMGLMDNTFYYYISGNPFASQEKVQRIQAFGQFMKSTDIDNFHVIYDEFNSSISGVSTIGEGMSRAFATIFVDYLGFTDEEFEKEVKSLYPPSAISYLEVKYLDIEYLFGSGIGVRKRDILAIEDIVIKQEEGNYLKPFGEMLLKLDPQSEMGNYYLGLFYENRKNFIAALDHYKKGYEKMDPDDLDAIDFYQNVQRIQDITGKVEEETPDPEKN